MAPGDALGVQRPSNASGTRNILGFQSDTYQRYAFLTGLLDEVCSPGAPQAAAPAIRILDIGSGPSRLTDAFLPSDVEIVRADVEQFGDASIVKIQPRQPLPFADDVFDVVLALDVLEHVPCDERALLVHECQRVARRVVILCCPIAHPEVVEAACFLRLGQTHYGTFFCGLRDIADAKAAERYVERERARCTVLTPVEIVGVTTDALLWLRRGLRHHFVTELAAKEAAVDAVLVETDAHLATLDAEVSNLREALGEKDAHIGTLDQRLAALRAAVERFKGEAAPSARCE